MALHEFICEACEFVLETSDTKGHQCPKCGSDMYWNISGINRKQCGDYRHISDSLAINPEQIPEHRELFPNIELHSDGRPEFTSVKQQSDYLDKTGFYKRPQKIRNKL